MLLIQMMEDYNYEKFLKILKLEFYLSNVQLFSGNKFFNVEQARQYRWISSLLFYFLIFFFILPVLVIETNFGTFLTFIDIKISFFLRFSLSYNKLKYF